nr:PREDICTED: uncharacterized protein LOC663463 [Tribolium castaneum]|eukprot:XP_015839882.1 PREDICTED: uncharacterized protein LOC663463 [Tribolium castaneum]
MAHNLDVDLTEFVRFNIKCIQFFGYFSPDFRNNSQRKLLFRIYAALFVGFAFILSLLSQIANMVDAFGDIEKMTEASFLLFTNLVQCFKIYTFANHGKKVWNLVYSMNRSDFKPNNLAQYWIVVNEIKTSKIISKLFLLACTLTCVSWAISPLLDKRGSDELRLPLSGWYPFSTEKSPAFEFAYTYQIFTTWVGGLGDISMDTFMSGTIMVISTQLSLLKDGLENVARNIKHDKSSVNKNLIQCACHYRSIIQFAAEVTNLFTTCITAQFVVGVIIVCMSMFQMSLVSVLSFQFAAMLLYQICVLMEIYLWCFYGNEVMLKSDQLTQAAYMSEWLDGTEEFKQNLLFLMTRTQFPLKLYASGIKMDNDPIYKLDLRDLVKINVKSIEFFGYLSPDFHSFLAKILYFIYASTFVGFMFVLYTTSEVINMILVFGDIEKMTGASFLLLTHLVQISKLYVLIFHKSKVRRLINSINREEFQPKNQEQYNFLINDIRTSKTVTILFLLAGFATCALWAIFPFLDKTEKTVKLPLSGWFPFDTTKSPVFECAFVYQTVGALVNGLGNISIDTFLSGIIMVVSGQLKILNNSLQTMKPNCKANDTERRQKLIDIIIHHRSIIQFAQEMTWLFTTCIMSQFVVSVIIICITMFQMSLVSPLSLQFLSMALYQACMITEIFLWCYYGNEVILQSGKLTQSAYMSQWLSSSKKFKHDLMFFMTRSQNPLKLYAGGYFTLSLETFMAIVKSSWSYFAVLNRVHTTDNV